MSFISGTNYLFTEPDTLFIAGTPAPIATNTALGEQHIVPQSFSRDVQLTLEGDNHVVQLVAFLNVADIGDNYPMLFEALGVGVINNVQVARGQRANGNYDYYCLLPEPVTLGSAGFTIQWTDIPSGAAFGAVWVSDVLVPTDGIHHSWPLTVDDISDVTPSIGNQRYAGGRSIVETIGVTMTFRHDYQVFGEPSLEHHVVLPAPVTAPDWAVHPNNTGIVSGSSEDAETIATWRGVLEPGHLYQLDYTRNGRVFSSAFDTQFTINGKTSPLARTAITFMANSNDLEIGVTGNTQDWDFQVLQLRRVIRPAPNLYLRKLLRDAGRQQPVILNIKHDELHDLAQQTWVGTIETPTQLEPEPQGGNMFEVSISLREIL